MTQYYIGCKQIEAWAQDRDGHPGYGVKYPDGYVSWSPKDTFERAYLPMGFDGIPDCETGERTPNSSRITADMVEEFINSVSVRSEGKTTIVHATLVNGFELVESSSCVDPANYDEDIGRDCCMDRIRDRVWHLLGFLLQTARSGVRP